MSLQKCIETQKRKKRFRNSSTYSMPNRLTLPFSPKFHISHINKNCFPSNPYVFFDLDNLEKKKGSKYVG